MAFLSHFKIGLNTERKRAVILGTVVSISTNRIMTALAYVQLNTLWKMLKGLCRTNASLRSQSEKDACLQVQVDLLTEDSLSLSSGRSFAWLRIRQRIRLISSTSCPFPQHFPNLSYPIIFVMNLASRVKILSMLHTTEIFQETIKSKRLS